MIDAQIGWAEGRVGDDETTRILRTTDGGTTWDDLSPDMDNDFRQSLILNEQLAWVWYGYGGAAFRTEDGGQNWTFLESLGRSTSMQFIDNRHGWRLDAEVWGLTFVQFDILSFATTDDGGASWVETNPPPGTGYAYMGYPDEQTAWAIRAAYAKSLRGMPNLAIPFRLQTTFNRGATWTTRKMPIPPGAIQVRAFDGLTDLGGVGNCEFVSPVYSSPSIWKLALTCEEKSWIYTSANQGKTWIISPMPPGLDARIEFINPTDGWLHLRDRFDRSQGRLYRTTNGGQSWNMIKRTGWTDVRLNFVDRELGWAVAASCPEGYCYWNEYVTALVKTTDGGRTWQLVDPQLVP
jgi:photosystem II stability/assembly factor-like uncharacterized protein